MNPIYIYKCLTYIYHEPKRKYKRTEKQNRKRKEKGHHITHATSNLGIRLNLKLVLYLGDLANPNNGLNLVPNCL
jgi:hypothetical protein